MKSYDVIVIGGGPAGLMAAAAAGENGARVLLLEKGGKLGRKLIISGGGRCNVTNRKPYDELIRQVPGNGRFMYSALSRFGPAQIIHFFEALGIRLKEEDHGRMFPVSDSAVTVANALIDHIRALGVEIRLNAPVDRLLLDGERCHGVRLKDGTDVAAGAVVVAVGGRSVPKTGSTGDGYAWAKQAGHTITPLYPTEVPVLLADPWVKERTLMGLSLREVELELLDVRGKRVTRQRGDLLFTHFGLSGPAGLRLGTYVAAVQQKEGHVPLPVRIDLFPDRNGEELAQQVMGLVEAEPKKAIKNVLKGFVPERMIPLMLAAAGIAETTTQAHLGREQVRLLTLTMKSFPVTAAGTRSLEEAFVTGGGVSIKEIDPKRMASKLMPGLYFAGEVMDVHAHTGGYNITLAFASGRVAGETASTESIRTSLHTSGETGVE